MLQLLVGLPLALLYEICNAGKYKDFVYLLKNEFIREKRSWQVSKSNVSCNTTVGLGFFLLCFAD